ncbi:MAG TPA: calcium/proton exchanger [Chroococcidiopsis sp.]
MGIKSLILVVLLCFAPVAIAAHYLQWGDTIVFVTSAIAIIPLSIWLSNATEKIAVFTGPTAGGLINAVFSNAVELIIALMALRKGLVDIVEASITGSILGALLLLLGLAMLTGGLRFKEQTFKPIVAKVNGSSMTLAVIALSLPSSVISTSNIVDAGAIRSISVIISVVLILVYGLTLLFSLGTHSYLYDVGLVVTPLEEESDDETTPSRKLWFWVGVLLLSTLAIAIMSDLFVGVIEPETQKLGLTPLFVGVILLPLLTDIPGFVIVVRLALKDNMDLAVATVTGDSLLLALFVAPVLILVGQVIGQPITLNFNPFQVIAIGISVLVANLISFSGRSNWLDGVLLLATYFALGVAFYFHPL